jgi:hypothetical protein
MNFADLLLFNKPNKANQRTLLQSSKATIGFHNTTHHKITSNLFDYFSQNGALPPELPAHPFTGNCTLDGILSGKLKNGSPPEAAPASLKGPLFPTPIPPPAPPPPPPPLCISNWSSSSKGSLLSRMLALLSSCLFLLLLFLIYFSSLSSILHCSQLLLFFLANA